ncbi:MAG TPA: hypothetical protein VFT08_00570 [Pyrinomonadaceae bacterium]|nr:hypothetical protein [Pyrinomonadaceae bacterium]
MKLPNSENAVVDIAKIRDYCLNPDHPEGKHKARIFLAKLGIIRDDAHRLRQLILEGILVADTVEESSIAYGRRFVADLSISWTQGEVLNTAVVRTAWIIRNDEDFPRLTTCFVRKE